MLNNKSLIFDSKIFSIFIYNVFIIQSAPMDIRPCFFFIFVIFTFNELLKAPVAVAILVDAPPTIGVAAVFTVSLTLKETNEQQ